jgi:cytoskeletal protein RodZ
MKEIGKMLREKREQMKISIAGVHKITKVQEKYLIAIEKGDMDAFFAEVYYKSFVRSYANCLGFDPEKIIELFNARKYELENKDEVQENYLHTEPILIKKNVAQNPKKIKKSLIIFATVIIVVVLLIVSLGLHKHILNVSSSVSVEVKKTNALENLYDQNENEVDKKTQDFKSMAWEKEMKLKSKENHICNEKQKLVVEATSNVWLRIDCDNKKVYEGTLLQGNKKLLEADKSFTLKIGYAPGVKVLFNGDQIDVLSGSVQNVNTVVLKRNQ